MSEQVVHVTLSIRELSRALSEAVDSNRTVVVFELSEPVDMTPRSSKKKVVLYTRKRIASKFSKQNK